MSFPPRPLWRKKEKQVVTPVSQLYGFIIHEKFEKVNAPFSSNKKGMPRYDIPFFY